jgi:hypothetical protein
VVGKCAYETVARVVYSRLVPGRTRPQAWRLNKSPHTLHAFANRSRAMVAATILIRANLLSFHSLLFVDDYLRTLESVAALIASDGSASLPGIRRGHTRPPSSDESMRPRTLSGLG